MRAAIALALVIAGCAPDLDSRPSQIAAPTVIAVAVEPPEVAPGEAVTLSVLVATPDGAGAADDARWALCTSPRPATDNNAVPAACLSDGVTPIAGTGAVVAANLSTDGCALFGPNAPPGGLRPRDPDPTGGYYQPVRVADTGADTPSFAMARLFCSLANAPLPETRRYAEEYARNAAPAITALEGAAAAPGEVVELAVSWPAGTAEAYLRYDPVAEQLVDATERLTVSWYVTAGEVELDRTEGDADGSLNTWTAPEDGGEVYVWAVVRDDRGGVGWVEAAVTVER